MNASYSQSSGPVSVGIDVSKHFLDVDLHPTPAPLHVGYDDAGLQRLLDYLRRHDVRCVTLEASGGYERKVVAVLVEAGYKLNVVNPRPVRDFAKSLNILAKTDGIDAAVLARFGAERQLTPLVPLTPEQEHRKALGARRRQMMDLRTAELNRQQQTTDRLALKSIKAVISTLDRQIKALEQAIDKSIAADPIEVERGKELQSVDGVGPQTSRQLIAELPELGTVNRGRITALAGLAPYNDDSGTHHGARTIRGGRHTVRSALYMATLTAIRVNPVIKAHFAKLTGAGKAFKVAMVACMRKLLIHLNQRLASLIKAQAPSPQTPLV